AEDGIRDRTVTGVQTCALPIFSHPTPGLVSITGSTRAGMEVAVAASADLKRTHLELGGKAPVVIFDDADLAAAAEAIAVAGYFKIGRASCRERVQRGGGAGVVE